MKLCLKCLARKPASEFYKNNSAKDGLSSRCKPCSYARVLPRKMAEALAAQEKLCPGCHKVKPFSAYNKDRGRRLGIASYCKECDKSYRESLLTNEQKARIREREWRAKMKEKGLCTRCGKNPLSTSTSCTRCQTIRVEAHRSKARAWKAAGLCWQCGSEAFGRRRCIPCRKKEMEKNNLAIKATRRQVIEFLGNRCACCGETIWRFLQLDHSNGKAHKRDVLNSLGALHRILKGERTDIRVLCINCNLGRAMNGGVCPHEEARLVKG